MASKLPLLWEFQLLFYFDFPVVFYLHVAFWIILPLQKHDIISDPKMVFVKITAGNFTTDKRERFMIERQNQTDKNYLKIIKKKFWIKKAWRQIRSEICYKKNSY